MARVNVPLVSFNRGIIGSEALARVDVDRTKLSAEIMTNWLPKTQGAMRIRPGTKHKGSSLNDTGAEFIEFVASTDDTALPEITDSKMRVWIDDALLGRPSVTASISVSDTGWTNASTGGTVTSGTSTVDQIPTMTGATTAGVTISGDAGITANQAPWKAGDDSATTAWVPNAVLPVKIKVDYGSGNSRKLESYSIRCSDNPGLTTWAPSDWRFLGSNYDTGSYATDTGKWTLEDEQSGQTGWAVTERRIFTDTGYTDTGANAWRHWQLYITADAGGGGIVLAEMEHFLASSDTGGVAQAQFSASGIVLNAQTVGALANAKKTIVITDTGVEHSLDIDVSRGPVTLRLGSTDGDDDYISESTLGTGYHNLAFTPTTASAYLSLQNDLDVNKIVRSIAIGDSGTVEITAPWGNSNLDNIRYDQSADIVYVDNANVRPQKIERRGTGRSWSVVDYAPNDGPFRSVPSSKAKLSVSDKRGNTQIRSDIPFFDANHVGALFRLTHDGQSGTWILGASDSQTDAIEMTGINDTGVSFQDTGVAAAQERQIQIITTGTWSGVLTVQRSFTGPETGFHDTDTRITTNTTTWIQDNDDNVTAWYRVKIKATDYTSGAAVVEIKYPNGSISGIARVTSFQNNQEVDAEVLSRFSDTGVTDIWVEGAWSGVQGYPSAIALHEGRLCHAGSSNMWLSVSDDFESFDETVEGESGPISRTIGSGPVDNVFNAVSLARLILETSGSEIAVKSSSLDEPLTPTNNSAKIFSTQGSANLRSLRVDSAAFMVQRSGQRVYKIGFGEGLSSVGDYESREMTVLVPDLLDAGVVSLGVQRQPDTRLHFVLADGRVAILTYEPQEEVLAWSMWETDTGTAGAVERVAVLPGVGEDQVYYHVRRTVNGSTKRFLEKWAMESETRGDTGLSWLADCAASYTDTGRATEIPVFDHLVGESLIAWGDDTGQSDAGRDLSPDDTGGNSQTAYTVDTGGAITLPSAQHHVVAGLPYVAKFKSTKMAYGDQLGTALTQYKRISKMGLILSQTHNNALFVGSDTGEQLDPIPRVIDDGAEVDADKIFKTFDKMAVNFPGRWNTDSRVYIKAKAPRPATVMAGIPDVATNEKV